MSVIWPEHCDILAEALAMIARGCAYEIGLGEDERHHTVITQDDDRVVCFQAQKMHLHTETEQAR